MEDAPHENGGGHPAKGGYGKRPLWQWILLYVVIGGIIYFLVYYFAYARHNNTSGTSGTGTYSY